MTTQYADLSDAELKARYRQSYEAWHSEPQDRLYTKVLDLRAEFEARGLTWD